MTATMYLPERMDRYIPPEAVAGAVRGFWQAFIAGGVVFFATMTATGGDTGAAWVAAGAAAFTALAGRTGEGYRDARKPGSEVRLSAEEQEVIDRLRDGSLTYEP